ncbi:hypothetical protein GCM10027422_04790 [Hymenobacter arcticus]
MNNIWLHRIKHHAEVSHGLLEKGYLTIGFSDFSRIDFLNDLNTHGWDALENAFAEEWGEDYRHTRIRYNLWRFLKEMKPGDWIVIPIWDTFSIYEISGKEPMPISSLSLNPILNWHGNPVNFHNDGLLHRENNELIDLGFFWEVKPIRTGLSRYDYADAALTSRMKFQGTNVQIPEHLRNSLEEAIVAFDKQRPINLHSLLTEANVNNTLAILHKSLNPDKFERLVKWYFERVGATNVTIPHKNESGKEGDADVVATFEALKTVFYAQVKFYNGEASSWAVEQISAYCKSKADKDLSEEYSQVSWVISSGTEYSKEAIELAKEQKIQLINGQQFASMLLQVGLEGLDTAIDR